MFVGIRYKRLGYKTSEDESIIYYSTDMAVPGLCIPQQALSARARFQFLTPIKFISETSERERWSLLEPVLALRLFGYEWWHRTLINIVNETGWPLVDYFGKLCSEDDPTEFVSQWKRSRV